MLPPGQIRIEDRALVQIVDAAVAESVRRSGEWVVCRAGCTPCCLGPFAITALDAARLRQGLAELEAGEAGRADAVRRRAQRYAQAIAPVYPGDAATGALHDEDALPADWEDVPCPALDTASGRCDLYEARPLTCRVFGSAMLGESGAVGACELCYAGVDDERIAACAVPADPEQRELALVRALNLPATIVAFALTIPGENYA
jgi:Fe-S-cluster containining protein